jgi:hypothetical protein
MEVTTMKQTLVTGTVASAFRAPAVAGRGTAVRGSHARRLLRPLGIALLLVGLCATQAAAAQDRSPRLPALWSDFGIGFGNLDTSSAPYGSSNSSLIVDATIGGRIGDHWLLGVNFGGAGSQLSDHNTNCDYYCDRYSSTWGQTISNLFLIAEFEPGWDHGWTFALGAGQVFYHNQALADLTGEYRSGDGTGGMARLGYDWPTAGHLHVQGRLTFEAAHIPLSSYVGGSANIRSVGLSVHIAYH